MRILLTTSFILFLAGALFAQSNQINALSNVPSDQFRTISILSETAKKETLPTNLDNGVFFNLNASEVSQIISENLPFYRFSLRFPDGIDRHIILAVTDIFAPDAVIKTDQKQVIPVASLQSRHFQGIVEGYPHSAVAISIAQGEVMGLILWENRTLNLAKMSVGHGNLHLLYDMADLDADTGFHCGTPNLPANLTTTKSIANKQLSSNPQNCVGVYVEVDHDIFQNKGGLTPTTNYITGLFNQVFLLFSIESINMNLSELVVWTSNDPYNGSSAEDYLFDFEDAVGNSFNGDIAHLVGYDGNGGVAYVDVLCQNPERFAYSGITASFSEVPNYSWSVNVVTHEIGHNLGSLHTHDCAWNGNNTAIDRCGVVAGSSDPQPCNQSAPLPSNGGTIMSYCHLISSVGINLANGFGSQPGDLIRDRVHNASCLSPCEPESEICDDDFDNDFDGLTDCEDPDCDNFEACLPCAENILMVDIFFDEAPYQISWEVTDDSGSVIFSSPNYENEPWYSNVTEELCLPDGCFNFTMYDSFGDGLCCNFGDGRFTLSTPDGITIFEGSNFGDEISVQICDGVMEEICTDELDNDADGLTDCEDSDCESFELCVPCFETLIVLNIQFDNYPYETSWELSDENGNVIEFVLDYGDIAPNGQVTKHFCVPDGCFMFSIFDASSDGICCSNGNGFYTLSDENGNILREGSDFGSQESTFFCDGVVTEFCDDGLDNDGDNLIDCDDPDCENSDICQPCPSETIGLVANKTHLCPGEEVEFSLTPQSAFLEGWTVTISQNGNAQTWQPTGATETFKATITTSTTFQLSTITDEFDCEFILDTAPIFITVFDETNIQSSYTTGICPGGSLVLPSQVISEAGTYIEVYSNTFGCDSLVEITVEQYANIATSATVMLCEGETTTIFGETVFETGDYSATFDAANGCDSTHTVSVQILPLFSTFETLSICAGSSITIFGETVSTAGTYAATFAAQNGCDSTHAVTVQVLDHVSTNSSRAICPNESITLFGETVSTAGFYSGTFPAANGCDSTHTIEVIILGESQTSESLAICDGTSIILFGETVSTAGIYFDTFQAANGCDSVHTIVLSLLNDLQTQENLAICDGSSTILFGETVSAAGIYFDTFQAANGCDSTHTIVLSLLDDLQTQENLAICDGSSTILFGETVSTAGIYFDTFQAANGCDSTHTIVLSLLDDLQTQENLTICDGTSTLIFGENVSEAGTYSATFQTVNGCDSTHTIVLSLLDNLQTQESLAICDGTSTLIFGETVSEAGTYSDTFTAVNGCDSTHTIELSLLDNLQTQENLAICDGTSTLIFGETVSEAGTYSGTFTAVNGCDSTHTIVLSLLEEIETSESIFVCEGEGVLVFGEIVFSPGSYSQAFTSSGGCDSTSIITLVWHEPLSIEFSTSSSCANVSTGSINLAPLSGLAPFTYNWSTDGLEGSVVTELETGTYTVEISDANQCAVTLDIEVGTYAEASYTTIFTPTTCTVTDDASINIHEPSAGLQVSFEGQPFDILYDFENLAPGSFILTFQTPDGCENEETIVIPVTPQISISATNITPLPCPIAENGAIAIVAEGGTGDLQYQWSNGASNAAIDGLSLGIYHLAITDENACELVDSFEITAADFFIDPMETIDHNCNDGTASISLDPTGGVPPYSVNWSDGQTGLFLDNLPAGMYSVVISDANNCPWDAAFTVPDVPAFMVNAQAQDPTCFDSSDGSIILTPSGGISPYSILWNSGEQSDSLSGLTGGEYAYTATAGDCLITDTVELMAPLEVGVDAIFASDANGLQIITALPFSGIPPYTYNWSNGQMDSIAGPFMNGESVSITVTDSNGCIGENTFSVTADADVQSEGVFRVFPNPTRGNLTIEQPDGIFQAYDLQIFDAIGSMVTVQRNIVSPRYHLRMQSYPAGIYFVMISSGAYQQLERVIVIR